MKPQLLRPIINRKLKRVEDDGRMARLLSAGSLDEALDLVCVPEMTMETWLGQKLGEKGVVRSAAIRAARLNPTFGYQIFTGKRHGSRDKLLRLAFGMGLSLDEASRLLELGGHNRLDRACRRDVVIAWELNSGSSVDACDDALWSHDLPTLA